MPKKSPQPSLFDELDEQQGTAAKQNGTPRKKSASTNGATAGTRRKRKVSAESMAAKQRDISVGEFFHKNRHLLGFDSPRKALLMSVKEAVDNALDACEEAGILPEIWVSIQQTADNRYEMAVQDNGPGIVKSQIPKI
ncbi:MAG: ATP-binding protein, partial [Planctomycetales bacterium]